MLSPKDIEWISTQYPGLKIDIEKKEIVGNIYLNRTYKDYTLTNIFSIKVSLDKILNITLPKVYETSGKLNEIAKKLNIDNLEDIHINLDSSLCLVIRDREQEYFSNGFNILEFFENCLEPYFFWISYYEKFGKAPWNDYAHGNLGFLELFSEGKLTVNDIKERIVIKELVGYIYHYDYIENKCLCGKNKNMKKCHPLIFTALKIIKNNWKFKKVS